MCQAADAHKTCQRLMWIIGKYHESQNLAACCGVLTGKIHEMICGILQ